MRNYRMLLAATLTAFVFLSASLVSANVASAQPGQGMQQMKGVTASGLIANNQIQEGKVSWIQGGSWKIKLKSQDDSMTGSFSATFTMVKPDGTSLHKHSIRNYVSDTVIAEGGELAMMGTADIYSGNTLKYSQVPITIHIMGKNVLGLMIDNEKSEDHFASSNEMYGIMTRPGGLDKMLTGEGGGMKNMESGMGMNQMTSSSSSSSSNKMPEFGNIEVTRITKDSAMVEGATSIPVTCQVEYGKGPARMDKTATDSMAGMNSMHQNHSVMLKDLEPGTTYSYRFKATVEGKTVYSDIMTFTTLKE